MFIQEKKYIYKVNIIFNLAKFVFLVKIQKKKIIVFDKEYLIYHGFKAILEDTEVIHYVEINKLLKYLSNNKVDLLIMELAIEFTIDGLELMTQLLKRFKLRILVFTKNYELPNFYSRKIHKYGGAGYLLKNVCPEEIKIAINNILEGGLYFNHNLLNGSYIDLEKLTNKELQIFQQLSLYSKKQIAINMNIKKSTVDAHIYNIKIKYNYQNSEDVIQLAKTQYRK